MLQPARVPVRKAYIEHKTLTTSRVARGLLSMSTRCFTNKSYIIIVSALWKRDLTLSLYDVIILS